ncbi:MAG: CSLREA domain-containing protein, partial [Actinomycetota bacterium]
MAGRALRLAPALALLMTLFPGAPASLAATTITVTTTDDELNGDGDCSLREAIVAANTDAQTDECAAGSGADTIVVPAGTYDLDLAGA